MSARPERAPRTRFRRLHSLDTRWMDNDVYGHVNNVVYYSYFDTVVNAFLIEEGLLDPSNGKVIGIVAETSCTFHESVAFPDRLGIGLAVERIGNSSVTYLLGVFKCGAEFASAQGRFVHVQVDRTTSRPVRISEAMRMSLQTISIIEK